MNQNITTIGPQRLVVTVSIYFSLHMKDLQIALMTCNKSSKRPSGNVTTRPLVYDQLN